jgi:hypothetical protein
VSLEPLVTARIVAEVVVPLLLDAAELDAAELDAAELDAAELDAAELDAAELDAAELDTAELDATVLDATVLGAPPSPDGGGTPSSDRAPQAMARQIVRRRPRGNNGARGGCMVSAPSLPGRPRSRRLHRGRPWAIQLSTS